MQFSMGTDPEFMLVDKDGNYRSAIDIVPGSKIEPLGLGNGHFAFYDNVLAECCPKYGKSKDEVIKNFQDCFQRYANVVKPFRLTPQASQTYPIEACQSLEARQFGCDPEFNAYDMVTVVPPSCDEGNTFRSGGGHIHLGHVSGDEYPLIDMMGRWWAARIMDFFVGTASVVMDTDPTSQARRRLYGGAGNMRPKEYGLEYRTLSVFWLKSPKIVSVIWDLCSFTLGYMQSGPQHQDIWEEHQAHVRAAIDNGDKKASDELLRKLANIAKMPKDLLASVYKVSDMESLDFYSEWKIK